MLFPTCTIEKECLVEGFDFVVGIDEAGRGPLCGSVVAGAVVRKIQDEEIPKEEARLIRDSKKLSQVQREKAFEIVSKYFWVGVGECDSQTIDRMNILEATMLAMRKAVVQLQKVASTKKQKTKNNWEKGTVLLVDGNKEITTSLAQRVVVGGDGVEQVIAAASIIAKVTRDREMGVAHQQFPQYGFDRHKGYGTKIHMEALKKYGPTPFHRMSFRPVRESVTMDRVNKDLNRRDQRS